MTPRSVTTRSDPVVNLRMTITQAEALRRSVSARLDRIAALDRQGIRAFRTPGLEPWTIAYDRAAMLDILDALNLLLIDNPVRKVPKP